MTFEATPSTPPSVRRGISPGGTTFSLYGRGEPLVLIHGVGMRQDAWAPQIESLSQTHQVLVYDMLGHGGSPLPPREAKLSDYAAQLAELLNHLDFGATNVAGHSMGALVALEFALSRPARTLRLAALNAVYKRTLEQRAAVLERAAQLAAGDAQTSNGAAIARWFGEPVPAHLQAYAQAVLGYLEHANPQGYARSYQLFASSDEAHAGRLAQLAMPVLYATGEFDANSSPAMSQAMSLVTPGAELEVLAGAKHMMNLTDAPRVNGILSHWLRRPLA